METEKRLPKITAFSRNLIALRKAMGVCQQDVADGIGVNLKAYQQWEYGYAKPSRLETFIALANFHQFFDMYALMSRDLTDDELSMSMDVQSECVEQS